MEKKQSLLLDVDEVICFWGLLDAINQFLGTNYKIDDFVDYYIDEVAIPKEKWEEFKYFIEDKNLYSNVEILPNAIETIEKLNKLYEVYICSSCINPFNKEKSGKLFMDKYNFLMEYLPFIQPKKFILTSSKDMVNADIIIDDYLPNLMTNRNIKILFPSYHNKTISNEILQENNIIRAGFDWKNGWNEINDILITKEKKLTLK